MRRIRHAMNMPELADKPVAIIGAGIEGRKKCKELLGMGINVVAFLDDNISKEGKQYYGVSVFLPDEINVSNCYALICIQSFKYLSDAEVMSMPIIRKINLSADSIILYDNRDSLERKLRKYLVGENVLCDKEKLQIGGIRLPNYLLSPEPIRNIFLSECGDLLLPDVFNDLSEIDDGPYILPPYIVISQGDVVFDCGANLGIFSAVAASCAQKVYAVEPVPRTIAYLEKVADMYNNIEIIPVAVTDRNGTTYMTDSENIDGNKVPAFNNKGGMIEVKSKTVDSLTDELGLTRVDFIKADIEGGERNLLRGATNTLREYAPKISVCEYHLPDDPDVLESIILEANSSYVVLHKYGKLYAYVPQML